MVASGPAKRCREPTVGRRGSSFTVRHTPRPIQRSGWRAAGFDPDAPAAALSSSDGSEGGMLGVKGRRNVAQTLACASWANPKHGGGGGMLMIVSRTRCH
jgi:hypothetical protein